MPVDGEWRFKMEDLIRRLEAAGVGSRGLDSEIMALTYSWEQRHIGATCWDDHESTCCPGAKHIDWVWVDPTTDRWVTNSKTGFEFTASLDAALALAERVLPDYWWLVRSNEGDTGFFANLGLNGTNPNMGAKCFPVFSASAPLALCIAILRAKMEAEK